MIWWFSIKISLIWPSKGEDGSMIRAARMSVCIEVRQFHRNFNRFLSTIKLNALILIGGHSTRMKTDKSVLVYNGLPQRDFLYDLLKPYCEQVFLSCREDQLSELTNFKTITDQYQNAGPLGAILTAFEKNTDSAWLVMACDMPFVNDKAVEFLIKHRNQTKNATAFQNPESQCLEPLFTIWEPSAYIFLKNAFEREQRSPMKILQQLDCETIIPVDDKWLVNVNSSEG